MKSQKYWRVKGRASKYRNISIVCVICTIVVMSSMAFQSKSVEEIIEESTQNKLVQKALQEKFDKYLETYVARCKKDAIQRAELYVDSLVAEELKIQASDTLYFPSRPNRPQSPNEIILNDSTDISPILKK